MVKVITGGTHEFNALVYGEKHPGTLQYLQNQVDQIGTHLTNFSQTVSDAGKNFFESTKALYERFNGSEAMRLAHAAVRRMQAIFQPNSIRPLVDLGAIQNAPLVMQRYIMANPVVRQFYNEQRCDGYSDTYVDMHPGDIGRDHYDYRRVMHGLVTEELDDDSVPMVTFFFDDLPDGDRELTLDEKIDITNVWDLVASMMKEGSDDPTSQYGSKL